MGKSEIYLFFENLRSYMYIKGHSHSLNFSKGHSVLYLKSCFSEKTVALIETSNHVKASGSSGTKYLYNWAGHLTKMATTPIYGKNLFKSSSLEPT